MSVVQFHPWPPNINGLALSSLSVFRHRRENVGHLLRFAPTNPTQSGPPRPLSARLQTWRSDPPSRATSSRPGLSAHRSMFPTDDATRPRYAANRGSENYQASPVSPPHTMPSYFGRNRVDIEHPSKEACYAKKMKGDGHLLPVGASSTGKPHMSTDHILLNAQSI